MEKYAKYMQNREVSWLRFNERVLSEASQKDVNVYERLKFISIFTSNLDEFFMIRVGSLTLLKKENVDSKTGMTPLEQISVILEMLPKMYNRKDKLYNEVMNELINYNIKDCEYKELTEENKKFVRHYYKENIKPLLFAQIIDKQHPFPFLENSLQYILVELEKNDENLLGIIEIPEKLKDFIVLPGAEINFLLTHKIVYEFADELFQSYKIKSKSVIRVIRNLDFNDDYMLNDEFEDYKDKMKDILKKRKRQAVVRLESNHELEDHILNYLTEKLNINKKAYFYSKSPLNMKYVFELLSIIPTAKQEKILYPSFTPFYLNKYGNINLIDKIAKEDLLFSYPYDTMQIYLDLLNQASEDERVKSIKITIYRLAENSKVIEALLKASGNGKDVTVCMELKARFDEENNMKYADALEKAGCKIIYGFNKYKVHSKATLITYKDDKKGYCYITQIGTGNYNEKTARIYADLSFMTGNREIGLDTNDFFNNLSIGNLDGKYEHLVQSPLSMKEKFLKLIYREIGKGEEGFLFFKMNALTDKTIIKKIAEASQNRVKVIIIVRGVCCLLPGIKGETENIVIHSIVGRFLEHARIYQFGKGDNADVYICSADMMTRNMEQRVELACPIYDLNIKRDLEAYIRIQLADNIKGRVLNERGEYEPVLSDLKHISSQDYFIDIAEEKNNFLIEENEVNKINSCSNIGKNTEIINNSIKEKNVKKSVKSFTNFFKNIFGNK